MLILECLIDGFKPLQMGIAYLYGVQHTESRSKLKSST